MNNRINFQTPAKTRVVLTGSDTKLMRDSDEMEFKVMSRLGHKLLNARKFDKQQSGVFLQSAGGTLFLFLIRVQ
ncbi:hypothetical protein CVD28_12780 [Bacillus sp. M6-12]|nr:hypothetical protein CVD28_12780 [Bacillus sp. M6-12]